MTNKNVVEENEPWAWHQDIGLIIGMAVAGIVIPWIAGLSLSLIFPYLMRPEHIPLGIAVVTIFLLVMTGFGVGMNWRLFVMIGGFAVYNLLVGFLTVGLDEVLMTVLVFGGAYLFGGGLSLPFKRNED